MEEDVFICDCHTPEHQFVVSYDNDEPMDPVFINVRLNHHLGFFGRLKAAFNYVVKRHEANYDEVVLSKEKTERLIKTLAKKDFRR